VRIRRLDAAQSEVDQLSEWLQTADEIPDHVNGRLCELEADIERLEARRHAYDPDDIVRGGAFVILNQDGEVRIERGFPPRGRKTPHRCGRRGFPGERR
jgi:ParB family chromosome partitioning protein